MISISSSDTPTLMGVHPEASDKPGWAQAMRVHLPWSQFIAEVGWFGVTCYPAVALQPPFYFLVASTAGDAGIAARALACIAEVLGCMAQGEGGLRSGPAANREWASAFRRLESGDIAGGVRELAAERQKWMSR